MWALIGLPHLVLQALRQGLPLIITFVANDLGCSTADKAFLLGAFYPGYTAAMLPSGFAVEYVGAKRLMSIGLAGTAALLVGLPFAAGRAGKSSARALWQLWLVMCGMGALSAPLMPASTVIQREWMPTWLGAERMFAVKIPMLGMKTGRVVTNLAIPLLAVRFGWRAAVGLVYAAGTAAAAVAWMLGVAETVGACPRLSDSERNLLTGPRSSAPGSAPPSASTALPNIRLAEPSDTPAVVSLINDAYATAEADLWKEGQDFKRTNEAEIGALIDACHLYVACPQAQPGVVVGCVSFSPVDSAVSGIDRLVMEFGMLCVAPEARRAGVASMLITHIEETAKESGLSVVQCELLVPRDVALHPHAFKEMLLNKFYFGLGYVPDRVLPFEDAYPQVVATNTLNFECDAVVLQKTLNDGTPSHAAGTASAVHRTDDNNTSSGNDGIGKMLCDPAVLAVILAHTTTSSVNICFSQWAPTILLENHGLTPAIAGALLATANAVDIAGNFISAGFESLLIQGGWTVAEVQKFSHSASSLVHAVAMVGFTVVPSPRTATVLYSCCMATMGMAQSSFLSGCKYLDVQTHCTHLSCC